MFIPFIVSWGWDRNAASRCKEMAFDSTFDYILQCGVSSKVVKYIYILPSACRERLRGSRYTDVLHTHLICASTIISKSGKPGAALSYAACAFGQSSQDTNNVDCLFCLRLPFCQWAHCGTQTSTLTCFHGSVHLLMVCGTPTRRVNGAWCGAGYL